MALSWSGRRQLMYYGLGFIVLLILAWVVWASFFNTPPTCTDGVQNGTETGIDCGGSCALLCENVSREPTVLWARPFEAGTGAYTVAAYVQNNNVGSAAKGVQYSFQLFDDSNSLVKEVDGVTDLPPVSIIPIIVPNVQVGNRTVARVHFAFSALPVWYKVQPNSLPTLRISQQNLNSDGSRLSATLNNVTLVDANNVTLAAVLFDNDGVARAASKSLVQSLAGQSSVQVGFTWPAGVPNIVRAEITVLPSF